MIPLTTVLLTFAIALSGAKTHPQRSAPSARLTISRERARRAEDIFARTVAAYAALQSYLDTGSVDIAYGSAADPLHDRRTFHTYFRRKPRSFLFEYIRDEPNAKPRSVVWVDAAGVHDWSSNSGYQNDYDAQHETSPFITNSYPTNSTISMVPSLLWPKARLASTLTSLDDLQAVGEETVAGVRCLKLKGIAKDTYGATSREVNVRKTTIWVDAQTFMVVRIYEEWKAATAASVSTQTTTFRAHPNPAIEDRYFAFQPPDLQR